jgi:hypothetical protein
MRKSITNIFFWIWVWFSPFVDTGDELLAETCYNLTNVAKFFHNDACKELNFLPNSNVAKVYCILLPHMTGQLSNSIKLTFVDVTRSASRNNIIIKLATIQGDNDIFYTFKHILVFRYSSLSLVFSWYIIKSKQDLLCLVDLSQDWEWRNLFCCLPESMDNNVFEEKNIW